MMNELNEQLRELSEIAMPLVALQDSKTQFWLEQADIVWGFDTSKNDEPALIFGKSKMKACINDNKPFEARSVAFLYDNQTDSLEYLIAAVLALKGKHCYSRDEDLAGA